MDSLITASARALAAGDALGALKRVALRDDPPALALRGIAMAQLGEHVRARELLQRAESVAGGECAGGGGDQRVHEKIAYIGASMRCRVCNFPGVGVRGQRSDRSSTAASFATETLSVYVWLADSKRSTVALVRIQPLGER
jgi:hypothetical protein